MSKAAQDVRVQAANARVVLLIACGATFMAFLDLSVVNIAFPRIIQQFPQASVASLTWIVSGYAVMFAAFLTPLGRVADTIGRTKVFVVALAAFTVASILCGLAPNPGFLIASRFAQGVAAAGMIPSALGLVLGMTAPSRMTAAVGAWSASAGFSAVAGPVIGGVLIDWFGWRWVFFINGPIGLLLLVAALSALPRNAVRQISRLPDFLGTLALTIGVGAIIAALTQSHDWGWSSAPTLVLLIGGGVLVGTALLRSQRHPAPAIDTSLWRNRRFAVTNATAAVLGTAMFAWLLAGPLFLAVIWHWSILKSAGALSIAAVMAMVTSIVAGRVSKPDTLRWLTVLGAMLFAACCAFMATDAFGHEVRFWNAWVPAGLLGGAGLGFGLTALSSIVASSVPATRFAAGIGMMLTARQIGGGLGIAVLAAILSSTHDPVAGFHNVWLACAIVAAVAAVSAMGLADRNAYLTIQTDGAKVC
jgi:EmrB/QacA subfamily drug resistance transporter